VAAQTQMEARLAKGWTEALCIDPVGGNDRFLDLGGHSLAATQGSRNGGCDERAQGRRSETRN